MLKKLFAGIAAMIPMLVITPVVGAEAYPSKPIKLIVPFSAGGSTDNIARLLAERLRAELKQAVVVENRPGGNNLIATRALLSSRPDGYTLMLATNGILSVSPALFAKLPFDPVGDFTHLGFVSGYPYVVLTGVSETKRTLEDYIAVAREKPKSITYMVVGNVTAIAGAMLRAQSEADLLEVRYKGGADGISDLMTGRVDLGLLAPSVASPLIKAGKLVPLAVTTKTRFGSLPDVRTVGELGGGLADFNVDVWSSLVAPRGIPPEVAKRISEALGKVRNDPAFIADLEKNGEYPIQGGEAEVKARMEREIPIWKSVAKNSGMPLIQ